MVNVNEPKTRLVLGNHREQSSPVQPALRGDGHLAEVTEPAFLGRKPFVGALRVVAGVFRAAAAAGGPLGVPSGSETVTGRAGCLNWARQELGEGRRVPPAPTRRSYFPKKYG